MRGDGSPDTWASAMHDVKDAIRQTGFACDLAKHVSRHGRKLARFCDGRVSDRYGRRDFPAQQIKRKIPRRYESSDAAWLSQRVIEGDIVRDMRFRFGVEDRCRKEAKIAGGARNIQGAGKWGRLTCVNRFGTRELFQIAFDQVRNTQQEF